MIDGIETSFLDRRRILRKRSIPESFITAAHIDTSQRDPVSKSYRPHPSASVSSVDCRLVCRFKLIKSTEHVDLQALYRRKVRLGYTPDILTDAGGRMQLLHAV